MEEVKMIPVPVEWEGIDDSEAPTPDHQVPVMKNETVKAVNWTPAMEENLITLWHQHPCLYDSGSQLWHDKVAKAETLTQVAKALGNGLTAENVITRMATIRTMYTRISKQVQSGNMKDLTQRQQWIQARCDFLAPHIRKQYSQVIEVPEEVSVAVNSDGADEGVSVATPSEPAAKRPRKRKYASEGGFASALKAPTYRMMKTEDDHLQSFGNFIAHELRQIPSRRRRLLAEAAIINALVASTDIGDESQTSLQSTPSATALPAVVNHNSAATTLQASFQAAVNQHTPIPANHQPALQATATPPPPPPPPAAAAVSNVQTPL